MKVLIQISIAFSILFFSCQKAEIQTDTSFQSNWQNEKNIERPWAGNSYWLNPLQAWEQKDGELTVTTSSNNYNCVLLTHEINDMGDHFEIEVDIIDETDTISGGWVGLEIGKKGQFNDFRDDAVHGKGFYIGMQNIAEWTDTMHIRLTFNKQTDTTFNGSFISTDYLNRSDTLNVTMHHTWLNGLIAISTAQTQPELNVDIRNPRPYFNEIKNVNKPSGRNNKFSFINWKISGNKISNYPERKFGPILWTQHTLSNNTLKMSAQFIPIGNDHKKATLIIDGEKKQEVKIDPSGNNALFKIENWKSKKDHEYKVEYISKDGNTYEYSGLIKKEPKKDKIKVASLSCVDDRGFPHQDIVKNVLDHDADIYVFHGDQIYERSAGYGVERSSTLDYLRKWYIWGWSFRDFFRDKPVVIIPDDHDVFHGNLWGEGGKRANIDLGWGYDAQDDGGYKEPPEFVNMVHRTQTGHLPDAYDPTPVLNNISVYYTNMNYGGISFAILGDRQWKSAPKYLLPDAEIENGWPQNKKWNAKTDAYHPDAQLLGERQELFLERWAADWNGDIYFKTVISQSPFCNVATLPKDIYHDKYVPTLPRYKKGDYPPDDRPVADFDSNGWPQNKRNKAVGIMRKAFAIHLTGDQHLGSTGQYGIDEYGDAGYWVSSPAVSNLWPRRWFPAAEATTGKNKNDFRYVGDYEDGFGNKITVKAIANPYDIDREPEMVFDKAPGYSIIEFDKKTREIKATVWPRWASPKNLSEAKSRTGFGKKDNIPYAGWPIHISQENNYGKKAVAYLPEINIAEGEYIQLFNEENNELIYAIRPPVGKYKAKVFEENSTYKILKIKEGEVVEEINSLKIKIGD